MSRTVTAQTPSVGFTGLLLVAFIVLKLTHVINWSWVWVLAPLWVNAALTVLTLLVMVLFVAFATPVTSRRRR